MKFLLNPITFFLLSYFYSECSQIPIKKQGKIYQRALLKLLSEQEKLSSKSIPPQIPEKKHYIHKKKIPPKTLVQKTFLQSIAPRPPVAPIDNTPYVPTIPEKKIIIIIPSYNNESWYYQNIMSVLNQRYDNYRVIYINDCSTDHTRSLVELLITTHPKGSCVTLINNSHRQGALANIYHAVHNCEDDTIIALLDGDDWFPDQQVLQRINAAYRSKEVWFTHGTFIEYPSNGTAWSQAIPPHIIKQHAFRTCRHPSHLRTFYAWLFKKINKEDLMHEGTFFAMTWDQAIMFPIAEMAGDRHHYFTEIMYVYNMANHLNDNKVDPALQQRTEKLIRDMLPYARLKKRPSSKQQKDTTPPPKTYPEKPFVVIIPSYNNERWCKKNIDSIRSQRYSNYRIIIIDDHSTDNTAQLIDAYLKKYGLYSRCTFIKNDTRKYSLENIYSAIHSCVDDEIIVLVDGDDWLANPYVLDTLNTTYADPSVWLTHGTLIEYPHQEIAWSKTIPPEHITHNTFRKFRCPSHLKTFYAWLFKKINKEDLMFEGQFYRATGDQAFMFPLIEMAGEHHAFIKDILYVYNMHNALNDHKIVPELQNDFEKIIRAQPPYLPITPLFCTAVQPSVERKICIQSNPEKTVDSSIFDAIG